MRETIPMLKVVPYTAIDNIMQYQTSIWSIAKLLDKSGGELDELELSGIANAIMEVCRKIESRCYDLMPDEDMQSELEVQRSVEAAKRVYERAVAMAELRLEELKGEAAK